MPADSPVEAAVEAAADQLYGAPLNDFMSLRGDLAKQAKADGDASAAKAITALRKPTAAAAIVNRFALSEPDAAARLTELGDRLRRAQRDLDAKQLRELSTERRSLVAEMTKAALAERNDPTTALRDEVSATLDAALADPDVAGRLGRLLRAEQFSGFGLAPGPELTLVQGGTTKRGPAKKNAEKEPEQPRRDATSRRLERAAEKARAAFEQADEQFTTAEAAEQRAQEQVGTLTDELAELQKELDAAKRDLDAARKAGRSAKSARRTARSALDKAERQLPG